MVSSSWRATEPRTNFLRPRRPWVPRIRRPAPRILHQLGNDVGNESVADGGDTFDALGPDIVGQAIEHQARVAIHAQRVVVGNSSGFDGHRLMRQHGVGKDERSAAGFGLGKGVREQVLRVSEIGGNDDFAGCGKGTCDWVLWKGHDVTWQRCERLPDPSFEGVGRGGCVPTHTEV